MTKFKKVSLSEGESFLNSFKRFLIASFFHVIRLLSAYKIAHTVCFVKLKNEFLLLFTHCELMQYEIFCSFYSLRVILSLDKYAK